MGDVLSFADATGIAASNGDFARWLHAMADYVELHPEKLRSLVLVVEGSEGKSLGSYTTSITSMDKARVIGTLSMLCHFKANGTDDDVLKLNE